MSYFKTLTSYSLEAIRDMILSFIYIFALLYVISWFHEGGHYISAYLLGFHDLSFGYYYIFPDVVHMSISKNASFIVLRVFISTFSGVVGGILPLIYAFKHFKNYRVWTVIIFVLSLVIGCRSDIESILLVI